MTEPFVDSNSSARNRGTSGRKKTSKEKKKRSKRICKNALQWGWDVSSNLYTSRHVQPNGLRTKEASRHYKGAMHTVGRIKDRSTRHEWKRTIECPVGTRVLGRCALRDKELWANLCDQRRGKKKTTPQTELKEKNRMQQNSIHIGQVRVRKCRPNATNDFDRCRWCQREPAVKEGESHRWFHALSNCQWWSCGLGIVGERYLDDSRLKNRHKQKISRTQTVTRPDNPSIADASATREYDTHMASISRRALSLSPALMTMGSDFQTSG